jgi:lipoyl(octanoyl) transferase
MHGFSINIERETRKWFDQIVACGLDNVTSTSVQAELTRLGNFGEGGRQVTVEDSVERAVELFGKQYGREMKQFERGDEFQVTRKLIEDGIRGNLPEMKREMLGV